MPRRFATKNYIDGDSFVIGGRLVINDGATVEGLAAEAVADSAATTVAGLKDDLNALLAALRAAGLLKESAST